MRWPRSRQALPGADDRRADGGTARRCAPSRRLGEPDPGPVRPGAGGDPAAGAGAGCRRVPGLCQRAAGVAPCRPGRGPDLGAAHGRGAGRPPHRERMRRPDQRGPRRRRRHDPGSTRPWPGGLRRPPSAVGPARRASPSWRSALPRRCCVSSRSRLSLPASRARRSSSGSDRLPGRNPAVRRRRDRQSRPRRLPGARSVRHLRRSRPGQAAHLRCRASLLPRRQPRPRRAAGGLRLSSPRECPGSSSTASPSYESPLGVYGISKLPLRWTRR